MLIIKRGSCTDLALCHSLPPLSLSLSKVSKIASEQNLHTHSQQNSLFFVVFGFVSTAAYIASGDSPTHSLTRHILPSIPIPLLPSLSSWKDPISKIFAFLRLAPGMSPKVGWFLVAILDLGFWVLFWISSLCFCCLRLDVDSVIRGWLVGLERCEFMSLFEFVWRRFIFDLSAFLSWMKWSCLGWVSYSFIIGPACLLMIFFF